ncbi:LysE family translocator [uncultured Ferrovibrio sp.]|jgi:Putative threonine efflux protein|uniref:LysE family translocator n=1 Tax=uncultured Ferrovibrio sp. TaxID=1576913 RepID=UPI0026118FA4|nr:LysE family translocator [uncultured Ferrovibrio sp.]
MDLSLYFAAALAGAAYTLTPGPAFLALLGIGAGQGRRAGFSFLAGHFAGDILWAILALTAIIGSASLGSFVFDLLGMVCGIYLFWLGWRAVTVKRREDGGLNNIIAHPLRRGLAFGLTNPKSYAVAVAMFTALLAAQSAQLTWASLPPLLLAACGGFVIADAILIFIIGAAPVRKLYRRHELWITRISGMIFIGFALQALWQSAPGLIRRV